MSRGGKDHFDEFADHTLLKHLVLEKYVKRWAFKLVGGKASSEVWFVDAFAGEGFDQKGNPGSPVIAGKIAEDVARHFPPAPDGTPPMRILAVELDRQRGERLQGAMHPFLDRKPPLAVVRIGTTLHDLLERFTAHVADRPTLFFLDPFGVDGLVVSDLPRLLSGPRNEVVSLFSDTGARRLYATLRSPDRNVEYEVEQVLEAPTLFEEMMEEDAARVREDAERSNLARRNTQEAARRIFTEAFGETWEDELKGVSADEFPDRALALWIQRLGEAGAAYVLSLPVRDSRNAHVYQLVYATKSVHGIRAMKRSIQEALNGSTLPREVIDAIQSTYLVDEQELVNRLRERFAGRRVRWAEDREEDSISNFLFDETPLLPGQFDRVRKALAAHGWREPGQTIIFRFPG